MNKFYYPKLAASNIKKNGKLYFPYLLTCIGTVMMFYIICTLSQNSRLSELIGGEIIATILLYGCIVVGLFGLVFLFYTNSFLIKRRKKEFGLYNVLGMEKKHISKIMLFESLYVTVISLTLGIGMGILFSKLVFLILIKMLRFGVVLGFEVPLPSIMATLILFACIFCLTLLNNLRQIHLVNPIELLRGGEVGEKEPKTKWFAAILGALCLGTGYTIALKVADPIAALFFFFIAVVLVIIGTYLLFGAGSIALLKILRKNKKFYYKTNHFISISGMMYRMKQNAAGLANICILSTMVLVMVSSTISLYMGIDDIITTRYPKEIMIENYTSTETSTNRIKDLTNAALEKNQAQPKSSTSYRFLSFAGILNGTTVSTERNTDFIVNGNLCSLYFIPLEDYNSNHNTSYTLDSDMDALLFYNRTQYQENTLTVFDKTFHVQVLDKEFRLSGFESAQMSSSYFLVVKDMSVIEALDSRQKEAYGENSSTIRSIYGFDLEGDSNTISAVTQEIQSALAGEGNSVHLTSRQNSEESFYTLYGGLFFLGIFLGIVFIMAAALIIYYKQVSEGYDDKERFEIMQKVGMSHTEIKKSIHSQVLTVFFLPLLTAGVHICFAFQVITKLLALLQLTNITLFLLCTIGTFLVFALFYGLIYAATAKAYYKIVS